MYPLTQITDVYPLHPTDLIKQGHRDPPQPGVYWDSQAHTSDRPSGAPSVGVWVVDFNQYVIHEQGEQRRP